jgi:hypothetical protein
MRTLTSVNERSLRFLIGVSYLSLILILSSCGKGSNPTHPAPTPPVAVADPKINSSSPSTESNVVIVHSGNGINDSVNLEWSTVNGSVTLNGEGVAATDSRKVYVGYNETKDFVLKVINTKGVKAELTWHVSGMVHPELAKITGTTNSGLSWKLVDLTSESPSGTIAHILPACSVDDIFTFYPYCKYVVNFGSATGCAITGTQTVDFRFNANNRTLSTLNTIPVLPDRAVTFSTSTVTGITTMCFTYTKNGYTYVEYYQRV